MAVLEAELTSGLPLEEDSNLLADPVGREQSLPEPEADRHLYLIREGEAPAPAAIAQEGIVRSIHEAREKRALLDLQLVLAARDGDTNAMDALIRRHTALVRVKASSYFLPGGDNDDLIQEGLIGLYKAARDFDPDKGVPFRSFAELCVTRQIITAIKTAGRHKHILLNTYVSFNHTAGDLQDSDVTLGDALPAPDAQEPSAVVISTEELQSLVSTLGTKLSALESDSLRFYLEGDSYELMAQKLECDTKTIDNALQRVKRKIIDHQHEREALVQPAPKSRNPQMPNDAGPPAPDKLDSWRKDVKKSISSDFR